MNVRRVIRRDTLTEKVVGRELLYRNSVVTGVGTVDRHVIEKEVFVGRDAAARSHDLFPGTICIADVASQHVGSRIAGDSHVVNVDPGSIRGQNISK